MSNGTQNHSERSQIAISGASGMVGSALRDALTSDGADVCSISRSNRNGDSSTIVWDPDSGIVNPDRLDGIETVVHLAGESIASSRWSEKQKARIRDSRVEGTRNLVKSMAAISNPPKTLICASAIGFYGDRGDEELTEESVPGSGFLPEVSMEWESAADTALELGMRVVKVRIGLVLSPQGGALQTMLFPFRMGVGGVVGSGKQYWSWIGLADLVRVLQFCIHHEEVSGVINAVSPTPVTNHEFTKTLGSVLNRPTILPVPGFLAKMALGEMANDLLLASARVLPARLQTLGFSFENADLEQCLRFELGRPA